MKNTLGAKMGLKIGFFCMFVNFLDISLKVNRIALNFSQPLSKVRSPIGFRYCYSDGGKVC